MIDTNGNQVVYNFSGNLPRDITDNLGRKINFFYDFSPYELSRATTIAANGQTQTYTFTYATLHVHTRFLDPSVLNGIHQDVRVLKEIILPNGLKYILDYDEGALDADSVYPMSRLNLVKITYPAGGYTRYEYTYAKDNQVDKWVTSKFRNAMDGKGESRWDFLYTTNTDPQTHGDIIATRVNNPDSTYQIHRYKPLGSTTVIDAGMETAIETYSPAAVLLQKKMFEWTGTFGDDCFGAGGEGSGCTRWNLRKTKVTTALDNDLQSKVEYSYDTGGGRTGTNGNIIETREYDYGSSAPGPLVRKTVNTYLTSSGYTEKNILDRITNQSTYDPNSVLQAQITYFYDEFSLTDRTGTIPGRASGYGTTFTTRGNLTSVVRRLLSESRDIIGKTEYDILGNAVRTIDARNFASDLAYTDNFSDAVNRSTFAYPTSTINPKGHVASFKYEFNSGLLASITDVNNQVTTRNYDSMNRLTSIGYPNGGQITYAYSDLLANLKITKTTKIDSAQNLVDYTYVDGLGRVKRTELVDPEGNVFIDREYDNSCDCAGKSSRISNPWRATDPGVWWTTNSYDALGRLTSVVPPEGGSASNKVTYVYSGNAVVVQDEAGKQKGHVYDALGRLVGVVEPDSAGQLNVVTNYGYNVSDKLGMIVQGAQTRGFGYDSLGRMLGETHPESGSTNYQYDDNGNMIYKTDARGITTILVYDELNRITSKTYSGDGGVTPAISYSYDTGVNGKGRVANAINSEVNYSYTYDAMGRTTRNDAVISGTPFYMTSSYNQIGDVTESTYPNGMVITSTYNAANRLMSVTSSVNDANHPPTLASGISYNSAGLVTNVSYGNGLTGTRYYNPNLQLKTLQVGTVLDMTYNYNEEVSNTGRIVSILDNLDHTKDLQFTYDEVYRLKTAETSGTSWGLTWTYDRYGNRLTQTATKGSPPTSTISVDSATNRVTGYVYDAAGNLTDDGSKLYQYDAENRSIKVTNKSSGSVIAEYQYDVNGQRVKKVANSVTTWFVLGTGEYEAGAWKKVNVIVAGARVEYVGAGTMYWNYLDHLSTARAVTDKSGLLVARKDYYPFGEEWTQTANNERKFTDQFRDSESGNDYFGARYYASVSGRWLSTDPVLGNGYDPKRLNRYSYCLNDPANYIDPDGQEPDPLAGFDEGLEWINDALSRNRSSESRQKRERDTRVLKDVVHTWAGLFDCKLSPTQVLDRLKNDWSGFANHRTTIRGINASITFNPDGPLTDGMTIPIKLSFGYPEGAINIDISVIAEMKSWGFVFHTNMDHVFSGTITFAASELEGKVGFAVIADATFADALSKIGFKLFGAQFEDKTWSHLVDRVGEECKK